MSDWSGQQNTMLYSQLFDIFQTLRKKAIIKHSIIVGKEKISNSSFLRTNSIELLISQNKYTLKIHPIKNENTAFEIDFFCYISILRGLGK